MQSATAEAPAPVAYDPRNMRDVYRVAGEAMELIHRHAALPDPVTFAVWFAYVARTNAALVEAVARKLARSNTLSPYEIGELYAAYLEDDPATAKRQNIGLEFEYSLAAVAELIVESVKNNDAFRASLDAIGQHIPNAVSVDEIDRIVSRLVVENQKMSVAMLELDRGLVESQAQIERLNREMEDLQNLSLRDPLTEVSNRRAFDVCIAKTIAHAESTGEPFCLAVVDIDHFKRINDTLGHQAGDIVLKGFSGVLRRNTKGKDMVARCGGEEFAIILPKTPIAAAHNLMVRIAQDIRETRFLEEEQQAAIGRVTASFGVSAFQPRQTADDLMAQADKRLYRAKHAGRDCVKSDLMP